MTDDTPSAEEVMGWLRADAVDTLYQWMRETGPEGEPRYRVRPQDDGTFAIEDWDRRELHRFRITVLVEPADRWDTMTWGALATDPYGWESSVRVRLNGVEATMVSAVKEDWHVDPRSNEYRPTPLEHSVVAVRLIVGDAERVYRMPPSGQVEVYSGALGEAVAAILTAFPGSGPVTPVPPKLSES